MAINKGSELHPRGEFLHNDYAFESVHDGDHDSVVRIFVCLSCKLWGFINLRHPLRGTISFQIRSGIPNNVVL